MSKNNEAKNEWSERKKFWAETVRTVGFAILAFYATFQIVRPREESETYKGEVARTKLQIRAETAQSFFDSSHAYSSAIYDAFCDLTNANKNADAKKRYEGEADDRYRSEELKLRIFFPIVNSNLDNADKITKQIHEEYTNRDTGHWRKLREQFNTNYQAAAIAAFDSLQIDKTNETHKGLLNWLIQ